MTNIAKNIATVRAQINEAAQNEQRNADQITLLAVSKTRSSDELRQACATGQKDFGENYLQEALDKIEQLQGEAICWHFIGPIQSNKTRAISENFDWVHSVDRLKIAQRLSAQRPAEMPSLNICLQVNISAEESKSGFTPETLLEALPEIIDLPNITVRGLMAIPASSDDPQQQRQPFAQLRELHQKIQTQYPALKKLDTLSMGMSGDMAAAIAEGSTMVRIGTAIFGARDYSKQNK